MTSDDRMCCVCGNAIPKRRLLKKYHNTCSNRCMWRAGYWECCLSKKIFSTRINSSNYFAYGGHDREDFLFSMFIWHEKYPDSNIPYVCMCGGYIKYGEHKNINGRHYCPFCAENFKPCDNCGKPQINCIVFNGRNYCNWCIDRTSFVCPKCSIRKPLTEKHTGPYWNNGCPPICMDCINEWYIHCSVCDGLVPRCDVDHQNRCPYCRMDKSLNTIRDYTYKPKCILTALSGERHPLYFGIELEVEFPHNQSLTLDTTLKHMPEFIYCKRDGSISYGYEMVSHPATLNAWQQKWKEPLGILFDTLSGTYKASAESQGLHIHISKGGMTESHRIRFQSFHDLMYTMGLHEKIARRISNYGSPDALRSGGSWFERGKPQGRRAVNWCPVQTVEIRMFRGTLDLDVFFASLEWCHAVYQFTKSYISMPKIIDRSALSLFKDFIQTDKRYKELVTYLKQRGV